MLSRRQKQADVGPPLSTAQAEKARAGGKGGKEDSVRHGKRSGNAGFRRADPDRPSPRDRDRADPPWLRQEQGERGSGRPDALPLLPRRRGRVGFDRVCLLLQLGFDKIIHGQHAAEKIFALAVGFGIGHRSFAVGDNTCQGG